MEHVRPPSRRRLKTFRFRIHWTICGILGGHDELKVSGKSAQQAARLAWKTFKARNPAIPWKLHAIELYQPLEQSTFNFAHPSRERSPHRH
jgi:hypothetical protein